MVVAADIPVVAAEAITASSLGSKTVSDFFPQARTSTSQRIRATFLVQSFS